MIQITDRISKDQMSLFHKLLCQSEGRYLSNPIIFNDRVLVHYELTDPEDFWLQWSRHTLPIKEINKPKGWLSFLLHRFLTRRIYHEIRNYYC